MNTAHKLLPIKAVSIFFLFQSLCFTGFSQTSQSLKPVLIEAEKGEIGDNFEVLLLDGDSCVTVLNNNTAYQPENQNNIITYQVTFADTGSYDLYAKVYIGSGGFGDDSFFYGKDFGENDPTSDNWYMVNGLGNSGFVRENSVVDGPGTYGDEVWKWVNLTKNSYQSSVPSPFVINDDELTKTFQIGGREDGLYLSKLAFGKSYLYYTVKMLEEELEGSPTNPATMPNGPVWEGSQLGIGQSKFVGCGYEKEDKDFANYWNQLTPGNAGKFGSVATTSDTSAWNWAPLDKIYNYALDNNILFKNHCLIWGQQQPAWLTNSGLSNAKQAEIVENWIRMVGKRYPQTYMIDVVNEALEGHAPAAYKDALGGDGETGWDWVIWSFEKARKYLPNAKLLLNDYNIVHSNNATTKYLQIINLLKERNLIDGIGIQAHRFELEYYDTTTIHRNLDRLAATNLPIYITELDLGNLRNEGDPDDDVQLALYQKYFPVFWNHPSVKGITFWGYREGEMWISTAFLVNYTGSARPALFWIADYIQSHPVGNKKHQDTNAIFQANYPNPCSKKTSISFLLKKETTVHIKLYNAQGNEITTICNKKLSAGNHSKQFLVNDLCNGVYFCILETETQRQVRKLVVAKE